MTHFDKYRSLASSDVYSTPPIFLILLSRPYKLDYCSLYSLIKTTKTSHSNRSWVKRRKECFKLPHITRSHLIFGRLKSSYLAVLVCHSQSLIGLPYSISLVCRSGSVVGLPEYSGSAAVLNILKVGLPVEYPLVPL
jgi:hypothetical protein